MVKKMRSTSSSNGRLSFAILVFLSSLLDLELDAYKCLTWARVCYIA